jgi:hypothetical protein
VAGKDTAPEQLSAFREHAGMPTNVSRFEILMYFVIALTVLITVFDYSESVPVVGPAFIIGMASASVAVTAARCG